MRIPTEAGRFSLIPLLILYKGEVVSLDPPIFTRVKVAGSPEFGLDPPRIPCGSTHGSPQSQGDSWRGSETHAQETSIVAASTHMQRDGSTIDMKLGGCMLHADAHSYLFLHASAHVASGLVGKRWTLGAASQTCRTILWPGGLKVAAPGPQTSTLQPRTRL